MKNIKIDFNKNRKIFFIVSTSILVLGLILNLIFGTKLDIDFAGGAIITYSVDGAVDAETVETAVLENTGRDSSVITSSSVATGSEQVTISFSGNQSLSLEEQQGITTALSDTFSDVNFEISESSSVDPVMGAKFFQKALICLAITVALLLLYIAFRFRKIGGAMAGLTAVIALVHDVLIIYFVFVALGMNIDDIFIAVILTILGYSLNDTIVIYDRIRENSNLLVKESPVTIMNISLNQVLSRSVLTSITTFIALTVVYVVSLIYGLTTVANFALPMMVGVFCGTYSSLFIAAPIYTMWKMKKQKKMPATPTTEYAED